MKIDQEYEHKFTPSDFYNELANSLNTYHAKVNDRVVTYRHESDISSLNLIEEFVKKVLKSNENGFIKKSRASRNKTTEVTFSRTKLSYNFKTMNAFINVIRRYEGLYIYSEYVSLFQESCDELMLSTGFFCNPEFFINEIKKYEADLYNELIELIREKSRTKEFKKRASNRKTNAVRQQKSAHKYIDALFAKCSRLLVLRIDLGYHVEINTSSGMPEQSITLQQAKKDFQRFKNNWRHNQRFKHLIGHIWKLECGEKKGYHYHLILFFRGSEVWKDAYISDQVGQYWRDEITKTHGIFHNCNARKKKYFHLGIGMIDAEAPADAELRANLRNVANYLTKNEQFLKIKLGKKDKSYGSGSIPERTNNRGRPRKGVLSPLSLNTIVDISA